MPSFGLNRLEDVTAGEVDRGCLREVEGDAGLVRADQRVDHALDVAARKIVRLQYVRFCLESGFNCGDAGVDDRAR
jgi:hypothetical protein